MRPHQKSCTLDTKTSHCPPRLQTSGRGAQVGDRKAPLELFQSSSFKVRKTKAGELTHAIDTWQSCTAPSASKVRPEFYQGAAQQGPEMGRAMGSWRAAPHSIPQAGKNSPETEPWVMVGWGGCSGPLHTDHNFTRIFY